MANIPIWPGSSSFGLVSTPTTFGFYDDDQDFQNDADKVSIWCAQRLGYPLVDVELQQINFYSCFEEAVSEYGAQVYNFQIIDNLGKIVGTPTGSSLNQINVKEDLSTNFSNVGGNSIGDYATEQRIYHSSPAAINRYFDPYAGTGTGIQSLMQTFGFGNYSPGVNFMLMPIYFDALKLQAIELNDQIRKSGYSFNIEANRYLKLFPIPTKDYTLHFEYVLKSTANAPVKNTADNLITDISNVPYTTPTYIHINQPGRQWIRRYALALAKEMLGGVRGKYQSVPIPGDVTTLDHARLLAEAKDEKNKLIEELQSLLDETTRVKQLERKNEEADLTQKTFYKVPYPIYIA